MLLTNQILKCYKYPVIELNCLITKLFIDQSVSCDLCELCLVNIDRKHLCPQVRWTEATKSWTICAKCLASPPSLCSCPPRKTKVCCCSYIKHIHHLHSIAFMWVNWFLMSSNGSTFQAASTKLL